MTQLNKHNLISHMTRIKIPLLILSNLPTQINKQFGYKTRMSLLRKQMMTLKLE